MFARLETRFIKKKKKKERKILLLYWSLKKEAEGKTAWLQLWKPDHLQAFLVYFTLSLLGLHLQVNEMNWECGYFWPYLHWHSYDIDICL